MINYLAGAVAAVLTFIILVVIVLVVTVLWRWVLTCMCVHIATLFNCLHANRYKKKVQHDAVRYIKEVPKIGTTEIYDLATGIILWHITCIMCMCMFVL